MHLQAGKAWACGACDDSMCLAHSLSRPRALGLARHDAALHHICWRGADGGHKAAAHGAQGMHRDAIVEALLEDRLLGLVVGRQPRRLRLKRLFLN